MNEQKSAAKPAENKKPSVYRIIHMVVGAIAGIGLIVYSIITLLNPKYSSEPTLLGTIIPFCVFLALEVSIGFVEFKKPSKLLHILHVYVFPILALIFLILHIVFAALIKRGLM